jgi:hypothetical protein
LVLALLAPWIQHSRNAAGAAQKPAEQLLLFDYSTAVFHVDAGDPDSARLSISQWGERVSKNAGQLTASLTECIFGTQNLLAQMLLSILLAIGLALSLARGPTLLDWHFASHVGLLLIYFTFDERLLLPLLPVAYVYIACALYSIARWGLCFSGGQPSFQRGALVAALPLAGLMIFNLSALPELTDPQGAKREAGTSRDRWDDFVRAGTWLKENTASDAKIMTEMAPVIAYHSGRRVYTNRFPRNPAIIGNYDIDYVVIFPESRDSMKDSISHFSKQKWVLPSHVDGRLIYIHQINKQAVKRGLDRMKNPNPGKRVRSQ